MASKKAKVATRKSSRVASRTKVTMDSDDVAARSDIQQCSLLGSASRGVSTTKKVGGSRKGNCSKSGRATRTRQVANRADSSADEDLPEIVEQNETLPVVAERDNRTLSSSDKVSHSSVVVNSQGREPDEKLESSRNVSVAQKIRQSRIDRPRSAYRWHETGDDHATTEQRSASRWRETDDSQTTGRKPQCDLDCRARHVVRFQLISIIISCQTDCTTKGVQGRAPISLDTALLIKQSTCLVLMDMAI
jgi:hypothetical protein